MAGDGRQEPPSQGFGLIGSFCFASGGEQRVPSFEGGEGREKKRNETIILLRGKLGRV